MLPNPGVKERHISRKKLFVFWSTISWQRFKYLFFCDISILIILYIQTRCDEVHIDKYDILWSQQHHVQHTLKEGNRRHVFPQVLRTLLYVKMSSHMCECSFEECLIYTSLAIRWWKSFRLEVFNIRFILMTRWIKFWWWSNLGNKRSIEKYPKTYFDTNYI